MKTVCLLIVALQFVYHVHSACYWDKEAIVGVASDYPPAVARYGLHELDLVFVAKDKYGNYGGQDVWFGWRETGKTNINGPVVGGTTGFRSQAALTANAAHKLDLFYQGSNGHLWTIYHDAGPWWSEPIDLGGPHKRTDRAIAIKSAPAATSGGPHKADVFYIGPNDHIWTTYWDEKTAWWTRGSEIGKQTISGHLTAVTNGPHLVEVFYNVADQLWSIYSDDGLHWSAPNHFPTRINSNPSAVSSTTTTAKGGVVKTTRTAYVFLSDASNQLSAVISSDRGPWGVFSQGIKIGPQISAASEDEVFFIGTPKSTDSAAGGVYRAFRYCAP
ncbi:MAG: hypothetical protein U1G07_11455 [Verrucomicrobiota bacterium]